MIPFHTLSERHLVYAYCAVWLFQFGYVAWLAVQWRKSRDEALTAQRPPFPKPHPNLARERFLLLLRLLLR